ncbi:RHS repeat-associated core domain-containing protein [Kribbella deserti]|uniref:RHS repeat-associated core domain-containing protein n=1 Tax=Kribbella deserti TaxID=1926257 RepID=A0ABV6QMH5_9ACTN
MPVIRPRKSRASRQRLVAGVVGLALISTCWGTAARATPVRAADDEPWQPRKERSVPGTVAKVKPRGVDPTGAAAVTKVPSVTWPGTVSGTATMPAPDWSLTPESGRPRVVGADSTDRGRAGTLPVWIDRPARSVKAAELPAKVSIDSLGRVGDALWLRARRADGVQKSGTVKLRVGYEQFRHAFGGDWALRLRLVAMPECALNAARSGKSAGADCVGRPVPTANDGSGSLTAEVPVTGSAPTLFAVEAAAASPAGDFKASALAPSATWQVGGASGDFTWRYPMNVPPSLGTGPKAQMSLEYSSGGVDGRTTATNNQPSWVGEGFEFAPGGAIERKYAACGSKPEQTGNNGTKLTGDLCFATDNATFTLNGKGGELVRDDATGAWRPRTDDGSKVERLHGAANGDEGRTPETTGEYWRLTTKDGTQYYFGLNKLPGFVEGSSETTKSSWTVPVFGNHANEQCNAATFAASWCQQAYRWNLDYVVDRHGNTMSFFYDTETNNYARNGTATTVSSYVRAGNLKRIEYGQRAGAVFSSPAVARVLFSTAERCIPGSACTTSQPATYPDTPLDQACNSTTDCGNKFNPTFWTAKRLAKVTTQVWRGSAFGDVSSWTLRHTFPDPGDGTRPGLWLEAVTNAGHVQGAVATPEVNFDGVQRANRVDGIAGIPAMNWWRISAVHYGTGGELAVVYSDKECASPGNLPAAADTNTKRCHPVKWTPEGQAERQDWFHKYVVTQVTESDRVSATEPVVTSIEYPGPPAWRQDEEDGLVEIGRKTWSNWRGYQLIVTRKGASTGPQTVTEHRYYTGMDGDKLANGGTKTVKLTDSTGAEVVDANALSGQLREQRTLNGATVINRTITDHRLFGPTATRVRSWATTKSYQVEEAGNQQSESLEGGALRSTAARHTYSDTGVLLTASNLNDVAKTDDDTCTRYEYASNPSAGIAELPARKQTVAKACDQAWTNTDVIADTRTYYDGSTVPGGTPTRGDVTKTERLSGFTATGQPTYQTVATAEYDAIGRATSITDAKNGTTQVDFVPASGGPLTKTEVTKPNGHTTSTVLEPAWGEAKSVVDPAGRETTAEYDALGRTTKVWLPGRAGAAVPDIEYTYTVNADSPSVTTTRRLQTDGSIQTSYEIADGLLRPRQLQQPAAGGGRVVTDRIYDSRGLEVKNNQPYYNDAPPGAEVLLPDEAALPGQTLTTFDAGERPAMEIFKSDGAEKWRTVHTNYADRQTVDPPKGEQAVTKVRDTQGRLIENRQYLGTSPTGAYDKTAYAYNEAGQLTSVVDPAGNSWSFEYDIRGRKIKDVDPDKGITTYTYDDLDQLTSSTDARGTKLFFFYDNIGRKTAVREGSPTGTLRSEWTYDTLAKGSPSTATRWIDGKAYVTRVTGYDAGGRTLGSEVTVPASENQLAGTYAIANTYRADGQLDTTTLPEVGGLPAETLKYGYNEQNLPTTLTGASTYVTATGYTPFGERESVTLQQAGGKWVKQSYEYQAGSRRLSRVVTDRELSPRRVSSVDYEYDHGGNVTKITDTPSSVSGEPIDTQCFGYDELKRMTSAWTPGNGDCTAAPTAGGLGGPAPYWQQWTFDKTGNRKTETQKSATGTVTSTYEYAAAGAAKPHALQKVTTTGTGVPGGTKVDTFGYDESGNQTARTLAGTGETLKWDAEGKLESVTKGTQQTSFVYDADGNRLLRKDTSGTTLFLGDTELLLKPSGQLDGTRYYRHGNQTVAVRHGGDVVWIGTDHQGTPTLGINAASQQVTRQRTTPYGLTRGAGGPVAGSRGFVGGTADASTGLVHLGAREYDPATGRFISVDPIADYSDPQQINGYAYANNSPVTGSDPDGKWAIFRSVVKVVSYVVTSKPVVNVVRWTVKTVTPVVDWVKSKLGAILQAIQNFIVQIREFVKKVITWVKQVIKKISTFIRTVITKVHDLVKKVGDAVKKLADKIKNAIKKAEPPQHTPTDLHSFGNTTHPGKVRVPADIEVDKDGNVHPSSPPKGKSTYSDPFHPDVKLTGHYWRLPAGTQLPDGLRVIADGTDVGGDQPHGHHTLYPTRSMKYDEFVSLYVSLPWEYVGKKK